METLSVFKNALEQVEGLDKRTIGGIVEEITPDIISAQKAGYELQHICQALNEALKVHNRQVPMTTFKSSFYRARDKGILHGRKDVERTGNNESKVNRTNSSVEVVAKTKAKPRPVPRTPAAIRTAEAKEIFNQFKK